MTQEKTNWETTPSYVTVLLEGLMKTYWGPLYNYIKLNQHLLKTIAGFLLKHEKIKIYLGKTHIGIEYSGPERIDTLMAEGVMEISYIDYSLSNDSLLQNIIGFDFDSTSGIGLPLPPFSEDLIMPTNAGSDKLRELGWNYAAQNSVIAFNADCPTIPDGQFTRIINSFFFHTDKNGLITRHIKWLDLIPIKYDDSEEEYDKISFTVAPYERFVRVDAEYEYPIPDDFKFSKLQKINRFIELTGNDTINEPQITKWLSEDENKFILTMGCGGTEVYHQIECEWQSEQRENIIPDFFLVRPNEYADIIEFKLPKMKSNSIVGISNRETFSSELNSYISQTRCYRDYFEDPNNRAWVLKRYGIKVFKPKRILVTGRRSDFKKDDWKAIASDYHELEIMTYDDLTDMVRAQFYL